jgi:hypothetical protein
MWFGGAWKLLTVALDLGCHEAERFEKRELLRRVAATSAWTHCDYGQSV